MSIPNCPKCGKRMSLDRTKNGTATKYSDCRVSCTFCELAYSNSRVNPTLIYKNVIDNIPLQLRDKFLSIIETCLNKKNICDKKEKMCLSSSEDVFTWIFFSYFLIYQKEYVLEKLFKMNDKIIDIYFWGTGYKGNNKDFRFNLETTMLKDFYEDEMSFSEPDIIIETTTSIYFIEIKFKSGNSFKEVDEKYLKYFYKDIQEASESKCYELIRNWSIGNAIAIKNKKNFFLYNIGLKDIFNDTDQKIKRKIFSDALNNDETFIVLYWEDIIKEINNNTDSWFLNEINNRFSFVKTQLVNKNNYKAPNFA